MTKEPVNLKTTTVLEKKTLKLYLTNIIKQLASNRKTLQLVFAGSGNAAPDTLTFSFMLIVLREIQIPCYCQARRFFGAPLMNQNSLPADQRGQLQHLSKNSARRENHSFNIKRKRLQSLLFYHVVLGSHSFHL